MNDFDKQLGNAANSLPQAEQRPEFVQRVLATTALTRQSPLALPSDPPLTLRDRLLGLLSGVVVGTAVVLLLLTIASNSGSQSLLPLLDATDSSTVVALLE